MIGEVQFVVGDADADLRERLDEEISASTGHHDGRLLSVAVRGDSGDLRAGLGWTWGAATSSCSGYETTRAVMAWEPAGFQNLATGPDLGSYAARSYSLMRPPRTGRRWIRSLERSATG